MSRPKVTLVLTPREVHAIFALADCAWGDGDYAERLTPAEVSVYRRALTKVDRALVESNRLLEPERRP